MPETAAVIVVPSPRRMIGTKNKAKEQDGNVSTGFEVDPIFLKKLRHSTRITEPPYGVLHRHETKRCKNELSTW